MFAYFRVFTRMSWRCAMEWFDVRLDRVDWGPEDVEGYSRGLVKELEHLDDAKHVVKQLMNDIELLRGVEIIPGNKRMALFDPQNPDFEGFVPRGNGTPDPMLSIFEDWIMSSGRNIRVATLADGLAFVSQYPDILTKYSIYIPGTGAPTLDGFYPCYFSVLEDGQRFLNWGDFGEYEGARWLVVEDLD